ncbi:MAG: hypothetical protein R2789_11580 [Microthrixaceae bacterium]
MADDEPASTGCCRCAEDGHCWVAVVGDDLPIGYVLVDVLDGRATSTGPA